MPSQLIPVVRLSHGGSLASAALADEQGTVHSLLDVSKIYGYNLESLAARMYGAISRKHPGVARLMDRGNCFLGEDVTLVQPLASFLGHYLLKPAHTRFIFRRTGIGNFYPRGANRELAV